MPLSALEQLRLAIADRPRLALNEGLGVGDGVTVQFQSGLFPIVAGSTALRVAGALKTPTTDYTLDLSVGLVTMTAAPVAGAAVTLTYRWVAFTDDELTDLLTTYVTVNAAAAQAVRWLLADTERFVKYTFGQETVDRTAAREALLDLLHQLTQRSGVAAGLVYATTTDRETLLAPFIEQPEDLNDDL